MSTAEISPLVLNYGYVLIDLKNVNISELQISLTASAILSIFQQIWDFADTAKLQEFFTFIGGLFSAPDAATLVRQILIYLYSVHEIKPEVMRKTIEAVVPAKGKIAMSTAEILIEKGIEKGIEKDKIDTARKMKARGLATELIAEITGLSPEEIQRL